MRKTIYGLVAAIAVMAASAVPAKACGGLFGSGCSPCGEAYVPCARPEVYVAPAASYGCNRCGGWAHARLPDPEQQYYYVNQGPTFTGPGSWAPRPSYHEGSVSGWSGYHNRRYRHFYR
jgi:hypothetical protein